MVTLQAIQRLLDQSKNEALLLAQSSLSQSQFEAFRKIYLNIFGKNGVTTHPSKKSKKTLDRFLDG